MGAIKFVRIADKETLREVGCPWKTGTLYNMHRKKVYPELFSMVGGKVLLVVDELKRMQKEGIGK